MCKITNEKRPLTHEYDIENQNLNRINRCVYLLRDDSTNSKVSNTSAK